MKRKRISMDKLRQILKLHEMSNLRCRDIASTLNISKTVVRQYISEFVIRFIAIKNSLSFCVRLIVKHRAGIFCI